MHPLFFAIFPEFSAADLKYLRMRIERANFSSPY